VTAEGTFPKSDGDILYASEVNGFNNKPDTAMGELIETGSLSGSSTSITSIPATSEHLMLFLRATGMTSSATIEMQFNSDTSNNYGDSTVSSTFTQAAGIASITLVKGSGSSFGERVTRTLILDYTDTSLDRGVLGLGFQFRAANNNGGAVLMHGGNWDNTADAISSIQVFPSSGTFSGSYWLYGVNL